MHHPGLYERAPADNRDELSDDDLFKNEFEGYYEALSGVTELNQQPISEMSTEDLTPIFNALLHLLCSVLAMIAGYGDRPIGPFLTEMQVEIPRRVAKKRESLKHNNPWSGRHDNTP